MCKSRAILYHLMPSLCVICVNVGLANFSRLVEISRALLALPGSNATAVMGSPDDVKLRSSMTLFSLVPGADVVFSQVLVKFFDGRADKRTEEIVGHR
jgi:uncharacterized protein (DUF1810 family)